MVRYLIKVRQTLFHSRRISAHSGDSRIYKLYFIYLRDREREGGRIAPKAIKGGWSGFTKGNKGRGSGCACAVGAYAQLKTKFSRTVGSLIYSHPLKLETPSHDMPFLFAHSRCKQTVVAGFIVTPQPTAPMFFVESLNLIRSLFG